MEQSNYTLAIDADGGDEIREHGTRRKAALRVYDATMRFLEKHPEVTALVSGIPEDLGACVSELKNNSRVIFIPASVHVPSDSIPRKDVWDSTAMYTLLKEVKENRAHGMYSSGNNKAYVFFTHAARLERISGLERCPIIAELPRRDLTSFYALDVGATTDCSAEQLVQFAKIGAVYLKEVIGRNPVRIGLISNGREDTKGISHAAKEAYKMLKNSKIPNTDLVGNVEPEHCSTGLVDLVVMDGGIGNFSIKEKKDDFTLFGGRVKYHMTNPPWWAVPFWLMSLPYNLLVVKPGLKNDLNPSKYGGAVFLGYESGVLVKGHGTADTEGIYSGLEKLLSAVKADVPSKIKSALADSTQII